MWLQSLCLQQIGVTWADKKHINYIVNYSLYMIREVNRTVWWNGCRKAYHRTIGLRLTDAYQEQQQQQPCLKSLSDGKLLAWSSPIHCRNRPLLSPRDRLRVIRYSQWRNPCSWTRVWSGWVKKIGSCSAHLACIGLWPCIIKHVIDV